MSARTRASAGVEALVVVGSSVRAFMSVILVLRTSRRAAGLRRLATQPVDVVALRRVRPSDGRPARAEARDRRAVGGDVRPEQPVVVRAERGVAAVDDEA